MRAQRWKHRRELSKLRVARLAWPMARGSKYSLVCGSRSKGGTLIS